MDQFIKRHVPQIGDVTTEVNNQHDPQTSRVMCKRCHFQGKTPCLLIRHLERKKNCEAIYSSESCKTLIDEVEQMIRSRKLFTCHICGDGFACRQSRYLHTKRLHKQTSTKDNIQPNAIQNTTNIVNEIVIINNNFHINAFLKEEETHIINDRRFLTQCVRRRDKGLIELVEKIHFDKEKPDNNNLKWTNKKVPLIQYHNGYKWMFGKKDKIVDEVIDQSYTIMNNHFEDHEQEVLNNLSDTMCNCIRDWMSKMDDKDTKVVQAVIEDIYLVLLNGGSK